jgi:predicted Zn-dependent protease
VKTLSTICLLLGAAVCSAETGGAEAELQQARAALDAGRFSDAFRHAARVQAFYYRDAEAMAAALYCEAQAELQTGGSRAGVSALTELKTLYPDSQWCQKALAELTPAGTE